MRIVLLVALIFNLGVWPAYSQSSCRRITAPDEPTIHIDTSSNDYLIQVTLTDPIRPKFYADGRIKVKNNKSILSLAFLLKDAQGERSEVLRGKESLQKIIEILHSKKIRIDAFSALWNDSLEGYSGPSDNLVAFMRTYRQSILNSYGNLKLPDHIEEYMPPSLEDQIMEAAENAAWSTWTGQQMKKLGFAYIEEIEISANTAFKGADGFLGAIDVSVTWVKKKPEAGIRLKTHRGKGSKSSLPRFHWFIHNMSDLLD